MRMAFEDIAGQDRVVARLRAAILSDRLTSGLIFYGIDGVGKRKAAYELARTLNCRTGEPACECESCIKIAHDSHPDLQYLRPDGQFIKMEQISPLVDGAALRPFEGQKRIYIFDEAECIREGTASRLLKTLEEPPLYTHFILLTATLPAVLPTIRSRCGLFYFNEVPEATIAKLLEERFDVAPEDARRRASLSRGSIGRALTLDEQDYSLQDEMAAWLERALTKRDTAPGELTAAILKAGEKTKFDLADLGRRLEILMDLTRDAFTGRRRIAGLTSFEEMYNLFVRLMQAKALISGNVNPEIVLTDIVISGRKEPQGKWMETVLTPLSWV